MINTLVVIAEDLSYPIDEGIKKTSFELICSLKTTVNNIIVFSNTDLVNIENIEKHKLPGNKLFIDYIFLKKIKALKPNHILYIPNSSGTVASFFRCGILKLFGKAKNLSMLVLQPRDYPFWWNLFPKRWMVDLIFTQSQKSVKKYNNMGFNVRFLPSGVDIEKFSPVSKTTKQDLRRKYGFSEKDKIIFHAGHIRMERNINGIGDIAYGDRKFLIVGSSSIEQDKVMKKELEKKGFLLITKYLKNIEEVYQLSDCYLFPVRNEQAAIEVPLSVLEAMACNLPVITSRFGGLSDLFHEGDGFYYWDKPENLNNLVSYALINPCNTRKIVESDYSWQSISSIFIKEVEKTVQ